MTFVWTFGGGFGIFLPYFMSGYEIGGCMTKLTKTLIVVGIVVFTVGSVVSCVSGTYNGMVEQEERVTAQWAQVQNVYQRRFDLLPNLVSTVKGYAKHENETFTQLAEARAKAGGVTNIDSSVIDNPEKLAEFQKTQDSLSGALRRLLVVTENYPELKANQNFLALQDELEGTENRIAVERKKFNDFAQSYNTTIRRFPGAFLANLCGVKAKAYFSAATEAASAPKVEF